MSNFTFLFLLVHTGLVQCIVKQDTHALRGSFSIFGVDIDFICGLGSK